MNSISSILSVTARMTDNPSPPAVPVSPMGVLQCSELMESICKEFKRKSLPYSPFHNSSYSERQGKPLKQPKGRQNEYSIGVK